MNNNKSTKIIDLDKTKKDTNKNSNYKNIPNFKYKNIHKTSENKENKNIDSQKSYKKNKPTQSQNLVVKIKRKRYIK